MGRFAAAFVSLIAILCPFIASAQTGPEVLDVRPFAPVDGTTLETVSLTNGTLSVHIPVWSFAQRGKLKLDFNLAYHDTSYQEFYNCEAVGAISPPILYPNTGWDQPGPSALPLPSNCAGGWICPTEAGTICLIYWLPTQTDPQYLPDTEIGIRLAASTDVGVISQVGFYQSPPGSECTATCEVFMGNWWKVRTPDGGSHKLTLTTAGDWRAVDGTGWEYQPANCTLRDNEGTEYVFACTPDTGLFASSIISEPGILQYVEDVNGNHITLVYTPSNTQSGWVDTMGRFIPRPVPGAATTGCPAGTSGASSWQIPGVATPIILCQTAVPIQTHLFPPEYYNDPDFAQHYADYQIPMKTLSGVILPSGDEWTFSYAPLPGDLNYGTSYNYGDLTQIGLPTGGMIQYHWWLQSGFCGIVHNS